MNKNLAFDLARVTEVTAMAAYKWIGLGDKNKADNAAVLAMREMLNDLPISGEIVIGEGEIDDAPMLFIGEKVGNGENNIKIDIAVDPIEGTRMVAMGQDNAIAVIAMAKQGTFLNEPDMYMEKIVVGPEYSDYIDLSIGIEKNIDIIIEKTKKRYEDIKVAILYKDRHYKIIEVLQKKGIRVFCLPDGDVLGAIMAVSFESDIDILYGIGGAPEGIVSAAAVRALEGNMQARLLLRKDVKGETEENLKISESELRRCNEMGVEINKVLELEELVKSDEIIFAATGITESTLLQPVTKNGNILKTDTLIIRGKSRTIRHINATHNLKEKMLSESLQKLIL